MFSIDKEYYDKPYYFYLKENNDDTYTLYFSSMDTLQEAKSKDEKINFKKNELKSLKRKISKLRKSKKKMSTRQMKNYFEKENTEEPEVEKTDIEELVDYDGTLRSSKVPIYNRRNTSKKTTDQTVYTTTQTTNPVTRGYRSYYGESKEDVVKEVDYSEVFGWDETKDMDGEETYQTLVKKLGLEPEDAKQRTKEMGKDPSGKRKDDTDSEIKNKKGFIDNMVLSELEKDKFIEMMETIISSKDEDKEITEKEDSEPSKILKNNISVIKKMAKKEKIGINKLIKMMKSE